MRMIRKATIEDIPGIRRMADVVFRDTYKDILSPEQMEYMMDMMYSRKGHIFFLDEDRGYASYRFDGCTDDGVKLFHLEKLYVMPDCRHTGLGLDLFSTVVKNVSESVSCPTRIELNVNRQNPAVSFYEHIGMKRARSGDFPIGKGFYMNDYIMTLDVTY